MLFLLFAMPTARAKTPFQFRFRTPFAGIVQEKKPFSLSRNSDKNFPHGAFHGAVIELVHPVLFFNGCVVRLRVLVVYFSGVARYFFHRNSCFSVKT
jgi:hypothetical protein